MNKKYYIFCIFVLLALSKASDVSVGDASCSKGTQGECINSQLDVGLVDSQPQWVDAKTLPDTVATEGIEEKRKSYLPFESHIYNMIDSFLARFVKDAWTRFLICLNLICTAIALVVYIRMPSYFNAAFFDSNNNSKKKIVLEDGSIYEGEIKNKVFDGFGTLRDKSNKLIYEGDWKGGLLNGRGALHSPDGAVFIGDFVNSTRSGRGKQVSSNGLVTYTGEYDNNKMHGKGLLESKQLIENTSDQYRIQTYDGYFEKDKAHGKGKLTYYDGRVYEGDFVADKCEGKGKLSFPDGSYYEGDFKDNIRTGKGTDHFVDGSTFTGGFLADKKHGKGVYRHKDPSTKDKAKAVFITFEGTWENDVPVGKGTTIYPDGRRESKVFTKEDYIQEE